MATVLLTPWALFQGASDEVRQRAKEDGDSDLLLQSGTALEVSSFVREIFSGNPLCGLWIDAVNRWPSLVDRNGLSGVLLVRKLLVSLRKIEV